MLYKFHWDIPAAQGERELVLSIHSISGWLGPKTLTYGAKELYRRGMFSGINHRIDVDGSPGKGPYHLKAARTGPNGEWRPTLYAGNEIIPEKLGTKPPHNPQRPASIGVTVGVTYLLILAALIMWPSIEEMLSAAYSNSDSKVFILNVVDDAPLESFRHSGVRLAEAVVGESYAAQLSAIGGQPPISWRRKSGRIPPGLTMHDDTGVIEGTPVESGDYPLTIQAVDSADQTAKSKYVIRVASTEEKSPQITTEVLPDARVGDEYSTTLTTAGGTPPYTWYCNDRKLPNGLKLKKVAIAAEMGEEAAQSPVIGVDDDAPKEWRIIGTPKPQKPRNPEDDPESIAGPYSIRLRVNDSAYNPRDTTKPWFIPICVTAICLLGFWSMARVSVFIFGAAMLIEIALMLTALAPVGVPAFSLQAIILLVGIANFKHMR